MCPRRLLVLGQEGSLRAYQEQLEAFVQGLCAFPSNTEIGVWTEVSIKAVSGAKKFDYKLDYVLMPLQDVPIGEAAAETGLDEAVLRSGPFRLSADGRRLCSFPSGRPALLEIMTSSTSGSNKSRGNTISQAFEHAYFRRDHAAPGINKRQVWSRMAGQLLVKSEIAATWGGIALWILQDNLVDYIEQTTGLDLKPLESSSPSDVNIVAVSMPAATTSTTGIQLPSKITLYSAPLNTTEPDGFYRIVRAPFVPPKASLLRCLARTPPAEILRP